MAGLTVTYKLRIQKQNGNIISKMEDYPDIIKRKQNA